ncbi:MAG: phosphopantetheine-binding protein [Patescibacteria group bacterium]
MSDYYPKVKKVIAEKTGLEPSEISTESYFEDDLNVGEMELMEILEELEETFHVDLIEDSDSFVTVQDVVDALEEHIQ